MIIYFEGPDGSGKSTLLNTIYNDLVNKGYKVDPQANRFIPTHPKAEKRVSERQLYRALKKMANDNSTVFLVDRGPISDMIYRVFDNYNSVTTPRKFMRFMQDNFTTIITLYCRTDLAEKKMLERGDENPIAIQRHKEITKVYDMLMGSFDEVLHAPILLFDYSKKNSLRKVMKLVNTFVRVNYIKYLERGGYDKA